MPLKSCYTLISITIIADSLQDCRHFTIQTPQSQQAKDLVTCHTRREGGREEEGKREEGGRREGGREPTSGISCNLPYSDKTL